MLVRFSSTAAGSITMFEQPATRLIRMMGATGRIPAALYPRDVPAAIEQLRAGLVKAGDEPAQDDDANDDAEQDSEKRWLVSLRMRAAPLLELLENGAARKAEVMWEYVK